MIFPAFVHPNGFRHSSRLSAQAGVYPSIPGSSLHLCSAFIPPPRAASPDPFSQHWRQNCQLCSLWLLAEVLSPPVSSKVLKRIARICSLHQSPATRIVLRLYHSHSSPSGDLKLLSSQRFSLNSHSPNSSTGIHFFVFFSIWQIDISSHLFIFFTYLSIVIGLKKVVTNCPKPKTQPWLILWCIWVFFKCRGFSSLVVIFILPPFAFNHARVAYCCMKRSF